VSSAKPSRIESTIKSLTRKTVNNGPFYEARRPVNPEDQFEIESARVLDCASADPFGISPRRYPRFESDREFDHLKALCGNPIAAPSIPSHTKTIAATIKSNSSMSTILPRRFQLGLHLGAHIDHWRKQFGHLVYPFSGADSNGNGVVEFPDYDVWRSNFGVGLGSGSGGASAIAIPEPTCVALWIIGSVLTIFRRECPNVRAAGFGRRNPGR